jgi:hypothetical protein
MCVDSLKNNCSLAVGVAVSDQIELSRQQSKTQQQRLGQADRT